MGGRGASSKATVNQYSGMFANDSSDRLWAAEDQIRTNLRNEESAAVMAADKDRSDFHLGQVKALEDQFREMQREYKKRGMDDAIRNWAYGGYEDAIDQLYISTQAAIRANNGISASFVYNQLNQADRVMKANQSYSSRNMDKSDLSEQRKRVADLKKQLRTAFNS